MMKNEVSYQERNLEGIRKVTQKKSNAQINQTFSRLMRKTKQSKPVCANGRVFLGYGK